MTCLNFTGVLDKNADSDTLDKYGCESKTHNSVDYFYNPSLTTESEIENLNCGLFDNSNYIRNFSKYRIFEKTTKSKIQNT